MENYNDEYTKDEKIFIKNEIYKNFSNSHCHDYYDIYTVKKLNKNKIPRYMEDNIFGIISILCNFNEPDKISKLLNSSDIIINLDLHKIYYYAQIDIFNYYLYVYELINDEEIFNRIYMTVCI